MKYMKNIVLLLFLAAHCDSHSQNAIFLDKLETIVYEGVSCDAYVLTIQNDTRNQLTLIKDELDKLDVLYTGLLNKHDSLLFDTLPSALNTINDYGANLALLGSFGVVIRGIQGLLEHSNMYKYDRDLKYILPQEIVNNVDRNIRDQLFNIESILQSSNNNPVIRSALRAEELKIRDRIVATIYKTTENFTQDVQERINQDWGDRKYCNDLIKFGLAVSLGILVTSYTIKYGYQFYTSIQPFYCDTDKTSFVIPGLKTEKMVVFVKANYLTDRAAIPFTVNEKNEIILTA